MQSRRRSTLEVSIDFLFSILFNIGGQFLVYGLYATAKRVTSFTLILLTLVYVRRYATRRLFNAWLPQGSRQPRWHSALESVGDTFLGMLIAYGLQLIIYGDRATLIRAGGLTVAIYALTMIRRYIIRRIFAWSDTEGEREGPMHESGPSAGFQTRQAIESNRLMDR
jgi:hypothetical protein